jgi:hypothetical protein
LADLDFFLEACSLTIFFKEVKPSFFSPLSVEAPVLGFDKLLQTSCYLLGDLDFFDLFCLRGTRGAFLLWN